ncbi:hypothetical protein QQZ08_008225 [Neonectria magnoliae]|uniref:Uncharacterized protein n=1 Tax=Neonectria magnoliae TaxID=2732573 RepID=A0ABR1HXB0_9HYPO
MSAPKIKLYTNHGCPWAHRAHIALKELGLPYEEEIIDLTVPRTEEYLRINPRGLVPTISYDGTIITESAIVSQFLADAHPSHLVPTSDSKEGALNRARINFFVDTYFSKINALFFKIFQANTVEEANELAGNFVDAIAKEIEPLLVDAAPYFGGSDRPTLAEVMTGSFIIRLLSLASHDLVPKNIIDSLSDKAPNFHAWAKAVVDTPSVNYIYDEEATLAWAKKTIPRLQSV